MNMAYYVLILDGFGIGEGYTREENRGLFTVEANVQYHKEVRLGDALRVELTVMGHDEKRLKTRVQLFQVGQGYLSAAMLQTAVNVDLSSRRVVPFSEAALYSIEHLARVLGGQSAG